jgi:hypothetical protein
MSDINGNSGDNLLIAGDGDGQRVFGLAGNDTLVAGGGNNQQLFGGDGADSLRGGNTMIARVLAGRGPFVPLWRSRCCIEQCSAGNAAPSIIPCMKREAA